MLSDLGSHDRDELVGNKEAAKRLKQSYNTTSRWPMQYARGKKVPRPIKLGEAKNAPVRYRWGDICDCFGIG